MTSPTGSAPSLSQLAEPEILAPATPVRRVSDVVVLTVLLAGTFMASLDVSIVNVAVPRIGAELRTSEAALQFVVSGYTVAYAALLITGARLGDDRGHRRLFLVGLAGFTVTSLACGLAPGVEVLVAGRVLQGAAAAMMSPQVLTIVQLRLSPERRARAIALYATVIAGAVVVGQVLGGLLVSADLFGWSWRTVFLVNVPLGLALMVLAPMVLPVTAKPSGRRLDGVGVLVLTITVTAVVVPLVVGREHGWPWWVWPMLAAAAPFGWVFTRHVLARQDEGGDGLVDLRLLRIPAVPYGFASVAAQMVAYGGVLFALTLHLQGGLGFSPVRAGLSLVTYAVAFGVTSLLVPRLSDRWRRPAPAIGLVVAAIGYLEVAWLARGGSWDSAVTAIALGVVGAGFGAGYSPTISRSVATLPPARAADASGMFTTLNQLSFAVGVAVVGSVYLAARSGDGAAGSGRGLAATFVVAAVLMLAAAVSAARQPVR